MTKRIILKTLFIIFILSANAFAASQEIISKNQSDLKKIEDYLQNIKYLTTNFIQEAPDGTVMTGKFYLSRPGKMRIEYTNPATVLVVVNGNVLTYKDVELDETSYLTTNTTPASLLIKKNISFKDSEIELKNFSKKDGIMKVSLVKKNKAEAGEFTLVFQENPFQFLKMEVKDDMDQITKITLKDHNFNNKIDDKLFVIKNNQLP